ncbi:MAG: hypothetical protein ACLFUF_03745 [Opitutales bacterium]
MMKKRSPHILFALLLIVAVAGCGPKGSDEAELVDKELRSEAFAPVAEQLDLGGQGYLFMDTQGYAASFAGKLEDFLEDMPKEFAGPMSGAGAGVSGLALDTVKNLPMRSIMEDLGLAAVNAYGESYYRKPDGDYRTSSFIYMPDGAQGIFALGGKANQAFRALDYAPADTDLFMTVDFDARLLYGIVENIAQRVMGETGTKQLNTAIDAPVSPFRGPDSLTIRELVENLPTRHNVILRLEESQKLPDVPVATPGVSVVLLQENRGGKAIDELEAALRQEGDNGTKTRTIGSNTVYYSDVELPMPFLKTPAVAIDRENERYFFSNNLSFLEECLAGEGGLPASEEYRDAVEGLPEEGTSLFYLSGKAYTEWANFRERLIKEEPMAGFMFGIYSLYLPILTAEARENGTAVVSTHLPDGILTRGNWGSALFPGSAMGGNQQQQTAVAAGLVAAMAIPAFEKVRSTSREKAIINNLRQLASAADQYFLENGVTEVQTDDLIGEDAYIRKIEPVAGERYPEKITAEMDEITATLPNGETVSIDF